MQKCGTGALKEFLKRNPFVTWSDDGESHFFDRGQNYEQGYDWYLNIQPKVISSTKVFDKTPRLVEIFNLKKLIVLCIPKTE